MKRVLIADDLGDQRAVYVTSLVLAGFVVDEASDGGMGRGDITAIPVRWMKR